MRNGKCLTIGSTRPLATAPLTAPSASPPACGLPRGLAVAGVHRDVRVPVLGTVACRCCHVVNRIFQNKKIRPELGNRQNVADETQLHSNARGVAGGF